jgi:hypothetical protein
MILEGCFHQRAQRYSMLGGSAFCALYNQLRKIDRDPHNNLDSTLEMLRRRAVG